MEEIMIDAAKEEAKIYAQLLKEESQNLKFFKNEIRNGNIPNSGDIQKTINQIKKNIEKYEEELEAIHIGIAQMESEQKEDINENIYESTQDSIEKIRKENNEERTGEIDLIDFNTDLDKAKTVKEYVPVNTNNKNNEEMINEDTDSDTDTELDIKLDTDIENLLDNVENILTFKKEKLEKTVDTLKTVYYKCKEEYDTTNEKMTVIVQCDNVLGRDMDQRFDIGNSKEKILVNNFKILGEINKVSNLVIVDENFTETVIKELVFFDIEYKPYKKLNDLLIDRNLYRNEKVIVVKSTDYDIILMDSSKYKSLIVFEVNLLKDRENELLEFFGEELFNNI